MWCERQIGAQRLDGLIQITMLYKCGILLGGIDFRPLDNGVIGVLVRGREVNPLPGQIQRQVADTFVLQLRVSSLQGVATDVGYGIVHGKKAGSLGLQTV